MEDKGRECSYQEVFAHVDLKSFMTELKSLEQEVRACSDEREDLRHLKKISLWGRLCAFLGYVTAAIFPNPISAYLISQGKFTRWTTIGHHVLHKAYDKNSLAPDHLTSREFAKGWRRYWDWLDWIYVPAWEKEHNVLHHYRLGERFDPDVFEMNVEDMRSRKMPRTLKILSLFIGMSQWKWFYYAPSTIKQLFSPRKSEAMSQDFDRLQLFDAIYNPLNSQGRKLWKKSYLPYLLVNFGLVPAFFLIFSQEAALNVLLTLLLAELITNIHTFLVIVPNHSGSDLYKFKGAPKDREEFCLRQIVGSVNYRTGTDLNDFLHGWLNYQIEHHLWPEMSMRQYQVAQPKLKALCEKYQVPYIQESVWRRFAKLIPIIAGDESMLSMAGKNSLASAR